MLSLAVSALQSAGLFQEPVCTPELSEALACEHRRCGLLAAHLEVVHKAAPQHAEPHRAALEGAKRRIAWLEHRLQEERVMDAWRREHPPTAGRELRAILYYLGLGKDPFPASKAPSPEPRAAPKAA
jgi:hypothetical protein